MLEALQSSATEPGGRPSPNKKPLSADSVLTMDPTPRIERMREALLKLERTGSINRARIEARVMKETEGEPMITRRAKAFAASVREMPIYIGDDELLVGCTSDRPRCGNIYPGVYEKAPKGLTEADAKELEDELIPYWKEQGRNTAWHYGHNIHGLEKVIKKGFLGIKKEAEERLTRIKINDPEDAKKVPFLEGVVMVMQACAELGSRYADGLRERAKQETEPIRKAELMKMAEVCDRVPANPAETFYEALQSYHFAWLLLTLELYHNIAFALGKMDQYLLPYYKKDLEEGRITEEAAQELLDCYILKLNEVGNRTQSTNGSIGVGGVKANGQDATNELSYMFIEAIMHVRLADPWFAVHVHTQSPDELLIKAAELTSLKTGHPQFLNTDVGIAQMLARGDMGGPVVTLEDARNSSNVGCLELAVPGKDSGYLYVGTHNLASALELALTNGIRRSDNKEIGAKTGDPRQFKSFEEIREAFRKQVEFIRERTQKYGDYFEQIIIDKYPMVYESALIEGCIEKGLCREDGGAHYNFNTGGTEVGSSDTGDSLTAIKKLVFEDKKITMAELCDALDANFEGYENIRKMCLQVPKFGNDDDYADEQKAWVVHQWVTEFVKLTNLRGGRGCPGGSSMAAYVPEGKNVGALPSGRLAFEPLAPAASPSTGKDVNGVTAVLKSMGKVDGVEVLGGLSLTARLDSELFRDKTGIKRMADMIRTFVDQKIFHLQLNVTSSETLRAAQKEPAQHRDLMVKVAGYNAYFTQLDKELQDTIIARSEHGL